MTKIPPNLQKHSIKRDIPMQKCRIQKLSNYNFIREISKIYKIRKFDLPEVTNGTTFMLGAHTRTGLQIENLSDENRYSVHSSHRFCLTLHNLIGSKLVTPRDTCHPKTPDVRHPWDTCHKNRRPQGTPGTPAIIDAGLQAKNHRHLPPNAVTKITAKPNFEFFPAEIDLSAIMRSKFGVKIIQKPKSQTTCN